MKAIIQIEMKLFHNNEFDLLTKNLLDLKICGKELFSYYFDLLNELEVKTIYLENKDLKNFVKEYYLSDVFAPKVEFIEEQDLKTLINFKDDDLLIIKNIGFILNSYFEVKRILEKKEKSFLIKDRTFEIEYIKKSSIKNIKKEDLEVFEIKAIQTISDYIFTSSYFLSNLETSIEYNVAYSAEDGIIIGKNVQIDKSCKLIKPLLILDNVKISKNCILGPNTIICNDVFIDENVHISQSIIYNNKLISNNLVIENKITSSNNIIDIKDTKAVKDYKIDENFIS